jgi:hypothetical protein
MSNEQLFYELVNIADRARRLGKSSTDIIGCLELVKSTEVSRAVQVKVEDPPAIVRATGLPRNGQ